MTHFRNKVRCACYLHSNPKTVALQSGVDNANFAKWLRGHHTLSEPRLAQILGTLRLPNGSADLSQIHHWQFDPTPKQTAERTLPGALSLYLGETFHAARLPTSNDARLFAFTNKRVHAFMKTTATDAEVHAAIDHLVSWRDPVFLNIDPPHDSERLSALSPTDFLTIWDDCRQPATIDDLLATLRTYDLTLADAVHIISETTQKLPPRHPTPKIKAS